MHVVHVRMPMTGSRTTLTGMNHVVVSCTVPVTAGDQGTALGTITHGSEVATQSWFVIHRLHRHFAAVHWP